MGKDGMKTTGLGLGYLCLRIGRVVLVCAWFEPHGRAPGPGVCVFVGSNLY